MFQSLVVKSVPIVAYRECKFAAREFSVDAPACREASQLPSHGQSFLVAWWNVSGGIAHVIRERICKATLKKFGNGKAKR